MLDQQFFENDKFKDYLNNNFIVLRTIGEDDNSEELHRLFKTNATPTVIIANSDGVEIDRIIGYLAPVEDYKEKLDNLFKSNRNFLALQIAFKSDTSNIELAGLLLQKYHIRDDKDNIFRLETIITNNAERAKAIFIPFKYYDLDRISAYECADFTKALYSPANTLGFAQEFPQSGLRGVVFQKLRWFLYFPERQEEAQKVFDELFKLYPYDVDLIAPFVDYCVQGNLQLDKALELSAKAYKVGTSFSEGSLAVNYAKLLITKGRAVEAESIYGEDFVKIYKETKNAVALNEYAWFWAVEGKYLQSALKAVKESLKLQEEHYSWDTLSLIYWKMGDYQKALEAEETALRLAGGKNEYYLQQIEAIKKDMETK